ncbi:hypothetical protein BH09PAT3_BH09PAT3_2630 [soil metagenome]
MPNLFNTAPAPSRELTYPPEFTTDESFTSPLVLARIASRAALNACFNRHEQVFVDQAVGELQDGTV